MLLVSGRMRLRSFVRGFRILEGDFKPLLKPPSEEGLLIDTFCLSFLSYFFAKIPYKAVSCASSSFVAARQASKTVEGLEGSPGGRLLRSFKVTLGA